MTDGSEEHKWLIYFLRKSWDFFNSPPLEFFSPFPYVVVSLMFERRFLPQEVCLLSLVGSGIFRCWLWIISCNDGSAWRVCLDSMPSLEGDRPNRENWLMDFRLRLAFLWMDQKSPFNGLCAQCTHTHTVIHTRTSSPSKQLNQQNELISLYLLATLNSGGITTPSTGFQLGSRDVAVSVVLSSIGRSG